MKKQLEAVPIRFMRNRNDKLWYRWNSTASENHVSILPAAESSSIQSDTKSDIISILPVPLRKEARTIIDRIEIDNSGRVIYKNSESPGSSAYELLTWYLTRHEGPTIKPIDSENFLQLMQDIGINISVVKKLKFPKKWKKMFD